MFYFSHDLGPLELYDLFLMGADAESKLNLLPLYNILFNFDIASEEMCSVP